MNRAFREEVRSLPRQVRESLPREGGILPGSGRLLLVGMGGSAMAAEFLSLAVGGNRETVVVRDDTLPPWVSTEDTLIAFSYSGNTTETLRSWNQAAECGLARAVVASGGALWEEACRGQWPRVKVPSGLAPRSSLGYLLRAGADLAGVTPPVSWETLADHLERVAARWCEGSSPEASRASDLAASLENTLPVLIAPESRLVPVARRWAADLSENAKVASLVWELPEAAHNAVMAVAEEAPRPIPLTPVVLGSVRGEEAARRWKVLRHVLADRGVSVIEVAEPHANAWVEAIGLAYAGDWVSLGLADREKVDAASLSLMNEVKHRLAQGDGKDDERE